MACYRPDASCPDVNDLFAEVYPAAKEETTTGADGKPVTTTVKPEPTAEETARKDASDKIRALPGPLQPNTVSQKCALYCQEIHRAEALRCQQLREKVTYALERAGCPSDVIPRAGATTSGCTPCQMYSQPQGMYTQSTLPMFVSVPSSNTAAATCTDGSCAMQLS